jgi:hypothetical protein
MVYGMAIRSVLSDDFKDDLQHLNNLRNGQSPPLLILDIALYLGTLEDKTDLHFLLAWTDMDSSREQSLYRFLKDVVIPLKSSSAPFTEKAEIFGDQLAARVVFLTACQTEPVQHAMRAVSCPHAGRSAAERLGEERGIPPILLT